MPKIATTIADVKVRAHTFAFITPDMTDKYKIPNPCTSCHTDKTTTWQLKPCATGPSVPPGVYNNVLRGVTGIFVPQFFPAAPTSNPPSGAC